MSAVVIDIFAGIKRQMRRMGPPPGGTVAQIYEAAGDATATIDRIEAAILRAEVLTAAAITTARAELAVAVAALERRCELPDMFETGRALAYQRLCVAVWCGCRLDELAAPTPVVVSLLVYRRALGDKRVRADRRHKRALEKATVTP